MADINLFREWVVSSHGRKSITWSRGLRARLGLGPEKSDEELATEQDSGEVVATVDRELWWRIVSTHVGARSRFLALLENGPSGLDDAIGFLDDVVRLGIVVQHRSDGPPRLASLKRAPRPPNQQPEQRNASVAEVAGQGGLPGVRLHDIRHFMATTMLADGVPVSIVSGLLGHERAATTLNVYSHFVEAGEPGGSRRYRLTPRRLRDGFWVGKPTTRARGVRSQSSSGATVRLNCAERVLVRGMCPS